mgnify:CR=1 FL=1
MCVCVPLCARAGWKQAHDAIRFEMDTLLTAIEKTKSLVSGGQNWRVMTETGATSVTT